jgi:hypothetical protein
MGFLRGFLRVKHAQEHMVVLMSSTTMIVCPASNIMPFWIIRTKGASRQIAEKKKIIKKKTWIHRKRYLRSPPQIDGGTPKVGTELADSHQEAEPTANELADSCQPTTATKNLQH